mmetsp:Transcript_30900/g.88590  ORF Transcript_30900/g.88590 Transcript_30900/m.88590 type:complete len:232 (-) Transcript_30900:114-809(-)
MFQHPPVGADPSRATGRPAKAGHEVGKSRRSREGLHPKMGSKSEPCLAGAVTEEEAGEDGLGIEGTQRCHARPAEGPGGGGLGRRGDAAALQPEPRAAAAAGAGAGEVAPAGRGAPRPPGRAGRLRARPRRGPGRGADRGPRRADRAPGPQRLRQVDAAPDPGGDARGPGWQACSWGRLPAQGQSGLVHAGPCAGPSRRPDAGGVRAGRWCPDHARQRRCPQSARRTGAAG